MSLFDFLLLPGHAQTCISALADADKLPTSNPFQRKSHTSLLTVSTTAAY